MFFTYWQNNSGGVYAVDKNVDKLVIIEAPDAATANERATDIGLFKLDYCACCGTRFYPLYDGEGAPEPTDGYGEPLTRTEQLNSVIHLASGLVARFR